MRSKIEEVLGFGGKRNLAASDMQQASRRHDGLMPAGAKMRGITGSSLGATVVSTSFAPPPGDIPDAIRNIWVPRNGILMVAFRFTVLPTVATANFGVGLYVNGGTVKDIGNFAPDLSRVGLGSSLANRDVIYSQPGRGQDGIDVVAGSGSTSETGSAAMLHGGFLPLRMSSTASTEGMYTVELRYKVTANTATVANRQMWAYVLDFPE